MKIREEQFGLVAVQQHVFDRVVGDHRQRLVELLSHLRMGLDEFGNAVLVVRDCFSSGVAGSALSLSLTGLDLA
jgi:hypothetical protein